MTARARTLATVAACAAALAVAGCSRAADEAAAGGNATPRRIVSIGGAVTETVFALGAGPRVVAVDSSSVFPAEADALPEVGYQRTLAAEGILALQPDLVIAAAEAGPPAALEQLRRAGVEVALMPPADTIGAAADRIRAIGAALGDPTAGNAMATRVEQAAVEARSRARQVPTRVLFLYARGGGTAMVSGTGTPAAAMIALAGAQPAMTAWDGFRPLSAEAAVAAAPDVILIPSRGLGSLGGIDGVLAMPGLGDTPAGRARRVVALDDLLLLGFGPRLPQAIDALTQALAAD